MKKSASGFTLIELILSVAILGLVAATLFPLFVTGFSFIARAGHRTESYFTDQGQIEPVFNRVNDANYKADLIAEYSEPTPTENLIISFSDSSNITSEGLVLGRTETFSNTEVEYYFFLPKNNN